MAGRRLAAEGLGPVAFFSGELTRINDLPIRLEDGRYVTFIGRRPEDDLGHSLCALIQEDPYPDANPENVAAMADIDDEEFFNK